MDVVEKLLRFSNSPLMTQHLQKASIRDDEGRKMPF